MSEMYDDILLAILQRLRFTCGKSVGDAAWGADAAWGVAAITQADLWYRMARSRCLFAHHLVAQDASQDPSQEQQLHQVICKLGEWQTQKFGPPTAGRSLELALGVVEELGEKATAWIEAFDTPGTAGVINRAAIDDAKGDMAIYLAQLLYHEGLSLAPLLLLPPFKVPVMRLRAPGTYVVQQLRAIGALAHIVLKRHQRIRGLQHDEVYYVALCVAAVTLIKACELLPEHLTITAQHVLTRDRSAEPGGDGKVLA